MKITRFYETSGFAQPATQSHNPVGLKPQDEFYVSNESVKGQKVMEIKLCQRTAWSLMREWWFSSNNSQPEHYMEMDAESDAAADLHTGKFLP